MRLAQLVCIGDQDTIPLRKEGIAFVPIRRGLLITIQHKAQTIKRLICNGRPIKREEMGMHRGKIRMYHLN